MNAGNVPNGHAELIDGHISCNSNAQETGDKTQELANPELNMDPVVESTTTEVAKTDGEIGDEVVVIQETGFNIKIVSPGVDSFDLPV